jgi:hypothetical protein
MAGAEPGGAGGMSRGMQKALLLDTHNRAERPRRGAVHRSPVLLRQPGYKSKKLVRRLRDKRFYTWALIVGQIRDIIRPDCLPDRRPDRRRRVWERPLGSNLGSIQARQAE